MTDEAGREPDGTEDEHEPTITYLPTETVVSSGAVEERVKGAFGFALVVERGPHAGMAYILAPGKTTIGRATDRSIFLDDVTVSRHHAYCTFEEETLVIEDEGSTNGTYVNLERVDRAELRPGDEIIIGKYHLIVARGDG